MLDALLADGILKFLYCEKVNGIFCLIVLLLHASFFLRTTGRIEGEQKRFSQ